MTQRLGRLEAENRRFRRMAVASLVGLAAVALMGQARPSLTRVVEAEKFIVRDANGIPRAALSLAPDGSSGLALADRNGKLRASLTVATDGAPALGLFDRDEKNRAALVVAVNGSSRLALYDSDGEPRAALAVGPDGAPEVVLQRR